MVAGGASVKSQGRVPHEPDCRFKRPRTDL